MKNTNAPKPPPPAPDSATETAEKVAEAIIAIDAAIKQLNASRLKRRAVALLLSDLTGHGITTIFEILSGMEKLRQEYLKS